MDFYLVLQAFPAPLTEAFERLCRRGTAAQRGGLLPGSGTLQRRRLAARRAGSAPDFYLNRFCFHGLWRVNAAGRMNVSYGHYLRPPIPTAVAITEVARVLQCARSTTTTGG